MLELYFLYLKGCARVDVDVHVHAPVFLQSGVVVNRTRGGTFDVYVQELHRRLRNLPRSQLRVIHPDDTDSDDDDDDDVEVEDHIDDSSDEAPPVTRRECVFWLLLACYQVMSENDRPGSSDKNAARYRHMKRLVLSHDQHLMSLARDAHVSFVLSKASVTFFLRLQLIVPAHTPGCWRYLFGVTCGGLFVFRMLG